TIKLKDLHQIWCKSFNFMVELRGIEPRNGADPRETKSQHSDAESDQKQSLASSAKSDEKHKPHTSLQEEYEILRPKRVPASRRFGGGGGCVGQLIRGAEGEDSGDDRIGDQ
ncbi:MAG: hypothetical protein HOD85_29870, partial [Deltaproteobacteria bacterium]|nr:hypothetical protein [Deltaproteobacteria bacterium]